MTTHDFFSGESMPESGFPLLTVHNLTVGFDTANGCVPVVQGLSFTLSAGQTLCLVGESGCGKSMTALALLRLIPDPGRITAGSVALEGQNLATLSESAMCAVRGAKIGMVFQEPMTSLNPVMRVGEQVMEPLMRHTRLSRQDARAQAVELFRQVGIPAPEQRLQDYPHQLSGGMRQRVMIAIALACKPRLLLADEPTTALDVTIQGQILALLREQAHQRGMGLLLITHDLGVVAEMADEVGVMYAGSLVEQAPVRELFAKPLHPYTAGLMRSAPTLQTQATKRLDAIPGTVPAPGHLPQGCPFRPRCRDAHDRCLSVPPLVQVATTRSVRCWLAVEKTV
ncbi:MAG: ABC transporter ATP-binding protein [Bilophila sp.]